MDTFRVLCTIQHSDKQSTLANYFMGTGAQIENVARNLCVCLCVVITTCDEEMKEASLHVFACGTDFCV
jgi:hypothetical protein